MYSFWAIFQSIHHVQNDFSVSIYTIIYFWCMVVYSMYSFRSWKRFLMRTRNPIWKPYIPYTTIHQFPLIRKRKRRICFLLLDTFYTKSYLDFPQERKRNPECFLYENDRITYQRISFKKETKERSEGKQYVFFLFDNDHTNYIFTEFPSLAVDNTVKRMKQKRNAMFSST